MARATTAAFDKFVVEVEWVDGSGTYSKWCGINSRGINRTSNMETSEVPDCDDESLPAALERSVRSQEVTISGSGVWAAQSHGLALTWWRSGATKNIRVWHANAEAGDTEYESGAAYLVTLNNSVERGQRVQAEISIEFDGIPSVTAAS